MGTTDTTKSLYGAGVAIAIAIGVTVAWVAIKAQKLGDSVEDLRAQASRVASQDEVLSRAIAAIAARNAPRDAGVADGATDFAEPDASTDRIFAHECDMSTVGGTTGALEDTTLCRRSLGSFGGPVRRIGTRDRTFIWTVPSGENEVECRCSTPASSHDTLVVLEPPGRGQLLDLQAREIRAPRIGERTINLLVAVVPSSARVTIHRVQLARVPYQARVLRSTETFELQASAAGFISQTVYATIDQDREISIELARE
jgi:hypothetical protein